MLYWGPRRLGWTGLFGGRGPEFASIAEKSGPMKSSESLAQQGAGRHSKLLSGFCSGLDETDNRFADVQLSCGMCTREAGGPEVHRSQWVCRMVRPREKSHLLDPERGGGSTVTVMTLTGRGQVSAVPIDLYNKVASKKTDPRK